MHVHVQVILVVFSLKQTFGSLFWSMFSLVSINDITVTHPNPGGGKSVAVADLLPSCFPFVSLRTCRACCFLFAEVSVMSRLVVDGRAT